MSFHASFFSHQKFRFIPAFLFFGMILVAPQVCLAHNVTIFAWIEGETVYTESKFSGGRKAKDAPIEVYDAEGVKLLAGKTDENGEFAFKLPKKEALKIVLAAGMGHGNEWMLTAEDIAAAQSESPATPESSASAAPFGKAAAASTSPPTDEIAVNAPEFQAVLERTLDQKLAPVLKKLGRLEATQKQGAGITEIIGGLGYILGLMGLAAFIHYKRKAAGLQP